MTEPALSDLRIKLFADGADLAGMVEMASKDYIQGLTTNPTLMKKVGITDYVKFARDVLNEVHTKPISFEVFSDEIEEMKAQGEKIAAWGSNVYVKVPITNTRGESMQPVVQYLSANGVKVNVTALMTVDQVKIVLQGLNPFVPSCISIFAGRIADTGRNPIPIIVESLQLLKDFPTCELIWASPRELLNIFQGDEIGCHVITATSEILNKLTLVGKDLESYSLDTVKMFRRDALESGFKL